MYQTYIRLLKECVAFRSISTDPAFQDDIGQTATWFKNLFTKHGFSSSLLTGYGNPVVLAEYRVGDKSPTVLIYGHYDVQPAAEEEGWTSDPFTLTMKDDQLIARGAVDNKGQIMIHITAIFDLIHSAKLTSNVVFFIEGNEETGSSKLDVCVRENVNKLTSDYILVSDGEVVQDHPIIEAGFRGVINATITLRTLRTDLHSGLMGGVAPSAAHEAVRLIATFHDTRNRVLIPGFYTDAVPPSKAQLRNNQAIPFSMKNYTSMTGSNYMFNESNHGIYTQTGLRPSLEITGLHAGYTGAGYRNSIPGEAVIKLNVRLVQHQKPAAIRTTICKHVKQVLPSYVQSSIEFSESCPAVIIDTSASIFRTVENLLSDITGKKVLYKYVGGSIPIVGTFQSVLKRPVLLIPLANEDCNMHGADENFRINFVKRSLDFSKRFFGGSE